MRDPRFIAEHRGGKLSNADHQRLALWAADCAERLLPLFQAVSNDPAPAEAIAVARLWGEGKVPVGTAQKASLAAHAAARACKDPAAVAAARAAGHAVATAHMADHALGPMIYGTKAILAAGGDPAAERAWQMNAAPADLRDLILAGIERKEPKGNPRS